VSAKAIDATSGEVICFARQTKFLPMGFWLDTALSDQFLFMANYFTSFFPNKQEREDLPDLDEAINLSTLNEPSGMFFVVGKNQTNLIGTLHGGCQAMIMEKFGTKYARKALKTSSPVLTSATIHYMSAGTKCFSHNIEPIWIQKHFASFKIALKTKEGALVSEGIFRWVNNVPQSKL